MGLVSWSTETHSYRDYIGDYRGYIRIMEKNGKLLSCNGVCIHIYIYMNMKDFGRIWSRKNWNSELEHVLLQTVTQTSTILYQEHERFVLGTYARLVLKVLAQERP